MSYTIGNHSKRILDRILQKMELPCNRRTRMCLMMMVFVNTYVLYLCDPDEEGCYSATSYRAIMMSHMDNFDVYKVSTFRQYIAERIDAIHCFGFLCEFEWASDFRKTFWELHRKTCECMQSVGVKRPSLLDA